LANFFCAFWGCFGQKIAQNSSESMKIANIAKIFHPPLFCLFGELEIKNSTVAHIETKKYEL